MKNTTAALILGICGLAGLASFVYLVPSYSTFTSIDSRLTRGDVRDLSRKVASEVGINLAPDLMDNIRFTVDEVSLIYLQARAGTRRANELVREDSIPTNSWQIIWFDGKQQSREGEKFRAGFSQSGKLLSYRIWIPDSTSGAYLDEAEAESVLHSYWASHDLGSVTGVDIGNWEMKTSEPVRKQSRQDWAFTFTKPGDSTFGLGERVSIRVSGNEIVSYERAYEAPTEFNTLYESKSTPFVFLTFGSWVVTFVLFAVGLIIFLKRYNEGEAGIGSSLQVSATYYLAAAASIVLSFPSISRGLQISSLNLFYESLISAAGLLLLWIPLVGVLTFSAWGIGESSARVQWPGKLFTFDAASRLKVFNERVGASILRGFAFAGILLGVYAVAHPIFSLSAMTAGSSTPLDSYFPSLEAVADSLAMGLFCETFYRFGVLSYFGRKRLVAGIVVSILLFIPSLFYDLPFGEYQITDRIAIAVVFAAAMIFIFLKYDFLTVLVTSVLFNLAHSVIPIFGSRNPFFEWNSAIVCVLILLPLVISFIALVKKQHFELTVDLMPKHIRRISERERMARELEIAKNVQNNLLPKSNPSFSNFEFGGICIPALEVGGDYYDFVSLPGGMIGTAIADVSGKGLPAAIYMTLTKGALQAYGEDQPSPRKVLNKINSIVYRSISRGTFISMIYAVLDTGSGKVRFARAGHNPLVFMSTDDNSAKLYTPNGIALGLDNTDKFDSTLEEMEITLNPGDILVFYTDGFSEAMDSQANEFGEARLVELIKKTRHLPVKGMLARIEEDVRKFVGGAPQHDDMTMVAIKVKE